MRALPSSRAVVALVVTAVAAALTHAAGASGAPRATPRTVSPVVLFDDAPDFDGDGFADLVVSVPGDTIDGTTQQGSVHVFYGSEEGPSGQRDEIWSEQNTPFVPDSQNIYGGSWSAGDFDDDGFDDLAAGIPGFDLTGPSSNEGAVAILYGGTGGLTNTGAQLWTGDDLQGSAQVGDLLGFALAAGDFDNDGRDDLAVGVPGKDVLFQVDAGAVQVLYGSGSGLRTAGNQQWTRESAGIRRAAGFEDRFGNALAVGSFDGNGKDDLAIGVPGDDVGISLGAGSVHVLYGASGGLTANGDQVWDRDKAGVLDGAAPFDAFGRDVAAGDFDDDGDDDLAVGVPGDSRGDLGDGSVHVLQGRDSRGLGAADDKVLWRDKPDVAGLSRAGDGFGLVVAVGDLDADGRDDLVVGIPLDDVGGTADAGSVQVFYGSSGGVNALRDRIFHRDKAGVAGNLSAFDAFGDTVTIGTYDLDADADLVVGTPFDRVDGVQGGAVNVLFGSPSGVSTKGDVLLHRGKPKVAGRLGDLDLFGGGMH